MMHVPNGAASMARAGVVETKRGAQRDLPFLPRWGGSEPPVGG
jgi:hypothetical protein